MVSHVYTDAIEHLCSSSYTLAASNTRPRACEFPGMGFGRNRYWDDERDAGPALGANNADPTAEPDLVRDLELKSEEGTGSAGRGTGGGGVRAGRTIRGGDNGIEDPPTPWKTIPLVKEATAGDFPTNDEDADNDDLVDAELEPLHEGFTGDGIRRDENASCSRLFNIDFGGEGGNGEAVREGGDGDPDRLKLTFRGGEW